MQLRHIRPGSVEWNDAITDQDEQEDQFGTEQFLGQRAPREGATPRGRDRQAHEAESSGN